MDPASVAMSLPKTYKKVVVTKKTTTWEEATKVVEVPMPQIAADEVLVKVIYAGVEASDIVQVAGGYGPLATAEPASIPDGTAQIGDIGCEGAGTVVAVGSEVKHLKAGDHVLFGGFGIAFREYLPLKAMLAIPIPALSPEIVAMAISGPTAEAFIQRYPIKEGDVALVTAAAGGTGHMAVQLLKEKGCHVIGTTSSDEKVETLKKLGVDRPVNYKKEKLADVLAKEYPKGINIIYEAVCAEDMFPVLVSNLAEGGTLVFIGSVGRDYTKAPHPINVDLNSLLFKSATVTSIFLGTPFIIQQLPAYLGALFQKWSSGKLKVLVDPTPFVGLESGVTQAQAHIRSGKNNGKVVVKIQEP